MLHSTLLQRSSQRGAAAPLRLPWRAQAPATQASDLSQGLPPQRCPLFQEPRALPRRQLRAPFLGLLPTPRVAARAQTLPCGTGTAVSLPRAPPPPDPSSACTPAPRFLPRTLRPVPQHTHSPPPHPSQGPPKGQLSLPSTCPPPSNTTQTPPSPPRTLSTPLTPLPRLAHLWANNIHCSPLAPCGRSAPRHKLPLAARQQHLPSGNPKHTPTPASHHLL
nr:PREDICTED: proline-rich receptor-like protein kinase PERK2 [Struthio camelus australis]